MPKIVKIRRYDPPNLLSKFTSNDISSASGTDLSSAIDYTYNSKTALRLWLRFDFKAYSYADLVNYNPSDKPTIAYTGFTNSRIFETQSIYSSRIKTVDLGASVNVDVTFAGNTNITSFGIDEVDSPFSVGMWFKFNKGATPHSTHNYFFTKGTNGYQEYEAFSNASGQITFTLFGNNDTNRFGKIVTVATNILDANWHHIVFTYDGRGGSNSALGLSVFINGEQIHGTRSNSTGGNSYTGMDDVTNKFRVGTNKVGSNDVAAAFGEFAIWAESLSLKTIKAIYNWTREDSVVKSGYTNLSSRLNIRDKDNRPGCYPTKHRMGDRDRSGKANAFYEDLPIQFANQIKDDFTNVPRTDVITREEGFDSTKWVVSTGMTIRRETESGTRGVIVRDRCAVFSGPGTGSKRFLRSASKIRNPYRFYFELLEGPYNADAIFLNLKQGNFTETLKLEISTASSFASPITVATYTPSLNPFNFFTFTESNSSKPRRIISLSSADFPDPGAPYYFRFVQENVTGFKSVWAIAKIEVEYANQENINYSTRLNHLDTAGNKFARKLYSLPHASGTLAGIGRAIKGISDSQNPFQDFSESISAFNDTLTIEKADNEFFNQGVDPDIYPGFSSPTRSKTKFTVDLSPSETTTFGYMNKLSEVFTSVGSDTSGIGQRLMVYWNKDLKRWEKIGKQLHTGNVAQADNAAHIELFKNALTSSCLGFSPAARVIFSGPDANNLKFADESFIAQSYKKTDLYTFPFGPQYFGSSSFTVKAKDIGITKPFLLEKTSIEFDAKFNFSKDFHVYEDNYKLRFHDTDDGSPSRVTVINSVGTITPTFFMLRQFNDDFHYVAVENNDKSYGEIPVDFKIPGNYAITQGSDNLTFVDKNREVITHKNLQLLMSESNANASTTAMRPDGTHFSLDDFIAAGLRGDANETYFYDDPTSNPIPSLTRRFIINSNVKMRTVSTDNLSSIRITTDAGQTGFYTKNRTGKTNSQLKNSRSIVNGFSSILRVSDGSAPGFGAGDDVKRFRLPAIEEIEKQHLYLILPNDDLIFGWQYPVGIRPVNGSPGSDNTNFCTMELFGDSKLHLYGSEIVENKEYHETVNQNLTSCAVYENIIGDEKIVDQWQVPYRGELTGSYNNMIRYHVITQDSNSNNNLYHITDSINDHVIKGIDRLRGQGRNQEESFISWSKSTDTFLFLYNVSRDFGAGSSHATAEKLAIFLNESSPRHQSSIPLFDSDRKYNDQVLKGAIYDDSTYGTQQSDIELVRDAFLEGLDMTMATLRLFYDNHPDTLGKKPAKYYFNTRRFGQYSDMIRQARDSKFDATPRQGFTTGFDIFVNSSSPVKVQFVSGSFQDDPSIKQYVRKSVDLYLDEIGFQSSNIHTAATSSIPFIEDDNNSQQVPSNRSYITEEFIAVPLF